MENDNAWAIFVEGYLLTVSGKSPVLRDLQAECDMQIKPGVPLSMHETISFYEALIRN